jgi:hypothetical protein
MAKTTVVTKKKRGPPATGKGIQVGERWQASELAAIDVWIETHDQGLTRGQAIRRLVEVGLAGSAKPAARSQKTAAKAKELAAAQIDRMVDKSAPAEEQASRKGRLLKGPEEFREVRVDRARKK